MRLVLLLIVLAAGFTAVSGWRDAFRVFGTRAPAVGWRVVRLRCRQPIRYGSFTFQLLGVAVGGLYFLLRLLTGNGSVEAAIPVAVAVIVLFQFAQPPSVVFLGTSTDEGRQLYSKIRWEIPGRSLSLLQSGALEVVHGTSFARTGDRVWQSTVRDLSKLAALVVVDARLSSPAVQQEAEWIVDSELRQRVVFIRGDDGREAVLQELRAARPHAAFEDLSVIQEHEIRSLAGRLRKARTDDRR
jgi:hypothetical protein